MYPGHNSHHVFRRIVYPECPEVSDDNHYHQHLWRELERQERAAAREKARERFKAEARLQDQYRQNRKVMEEDVSASRVSPLQLRKGYLTPAVRASPLFRLPATVRDKIFTYALTSPHPVPVKKHTAVQPEFTRNKMSKVSWRSFPPLLKVSRQVEAEAAPVFYRASKFQLKMNAVDYEELSNWVAGTSASLLSEVKQLTIVIEPTCFGDLQAIVEAKPNVGLHVIAEEMAATVKQGLPNAKFQVEKPKRRFVKALKVDIVRAGLDKALANHVWKEWKAEVDRAFAEG